MVATCLIAEGNQATVEPCSRMLQGPWSRDREQKPFLNVHPVIIFDRFSFVECHERKSKSEPLSKED